MTEKLAAHAQKTGAKRCLEMRQALWHGCQSYA